MCSIDELRNLYELVIRRLNDKEGCCGNWPFSCIFPSSLKFRKQHLSFVFQQCFRPFLFLITVFYQTLISSDFVSPTSEFVMKRWAFSSSSSASFTNVIEKYFSDNQPQHFPFMIQSFDIRVGNFILDSLGKVRVHECTFKKTRFLIKFRHWSNMFKQRSFSGSNVSESVTQITFDGR